MTPAQVPNVYSIPSGEPFLRSLASAILRGALPRAGTAPPDPVGLSDYRILLPTRRAVRSLAETFLQVSDGVRLLPRMTALGDVDEDELLLAGGEVDFTGSDALAALPAISPLERRLLLTRLILAWIDADESRARPSVRSAAQAAHLAGDLGRLIDMFDTEQADWSALEGLVEKELSHHWENALEFLDILRKTLPEFLAARGVINPMARRNTLLAAEAARLASDPGTAPVIAAGSTGSIPATAELLRVVAGLPQGALVLPGLDMHLEDGAWRSIGPAHPQYGLKQLLERIGIAREEVKVLKADGESRRAAARAGLLSEVMRPADASEKWSSAIAESNRSEWAEGLEGLHQISAPTQRDEALAIALVMRRTLEDENRTAALITPDRRLARRVSAELGRWRIDVDDSAGEPLSVTAPGSFARLIAEAVAEAFAPVPLLALLKHPLAAFGHEPHDVRRMAGLLEISVLRGITPRNGIAGLKRAVDAQRDAGSEARSRHPAVRLAPAQDWTELLAFLDRLEETCGPLIELHSGAEEVPAGALVRAHVASAEAACRTGAPAEDCAIWRGDAGEALAGFFAALLAADDLLPSLRPAEYGAFLNVLMAGHVVRARHSLHPRLHIWGLLEARLMQTDVVILGGLTEGTWPAQAMTDPWLNRPMRAGLDLEPPERRIGLSAHDFAQAASARDVYLTRAEKIDGAPSVPSRWLLRLSALLEGAGSRSAGEDGAWVSWALGMDHTESYRPAPKPLPTPPLGVRPRRMSVTRVESWVRDPYSIFARMILGLEPLDPLAADPSAADRGSIVHRILHDAVRAGGAVDENRLLAIGRERFEGFMDYPDVAAFWWPRYERMAQWLAEQDLFGEEGVVDRLAEVAGSLTLETPGGAFELTARADRIDLLASGGAVIMDYKTGRPPTDKQVKSGFSPQLPLEAAIAIDGGFQNLEPCEVMALEYIRLTGGEPPGERRCISAAAPGELAGEAIDGLKRRIARFDRPETPYEPRRAVEFERQVHDYDHLSRHKEWARQAAEDEA